MRFGWTLVCGVLALAPVLAQQADPPQRTITTRPDSTVGSDAKPATSTSGATLEQYRQSWQKMTPAQQQALVRAGGMTPEQYVRMLMGKGATQGKGASAAAASDPRAADSGAFDALGKSLQDLNAIRDGNLSLVQKDGCAPELASRITDLKAKLRSDELELNEGEGPAASPAAAPAMERATSDSIAVADDWFKKPAGARQAAVTDDSNRTREGNLLDAVLSGTQAQAPVERRVDPKSPGAEQKRKEIEADMARIQAELDQLSGACATAKR